MKILFVHSGTELTGSSTYAMALQKSWQGRHEVFWINDGLAVGFPCSLALPIRRKLFPHGLLNAIHVAAYARAQGIAVIHSHSRRANMVAAMAARLAGIPYVTSIHQTMPDHFFSRLWPCLGDYTIAVCDNVLEDLGRRHPRHADRMALLRNGVDTEYFVWDGVPSPETGIVTVLGRISGNRWRAVAQLLEIAPEMLARFPSMRLRFVGTIAPEYQLSFTATVDAINGDLAQPRVTSLGFVEDVRPVLRESAVVIAAGRSLLEALAMGRPVIAVGEVESFGLLTEANFRQAQKANFGDVAGPESRAKFDARAIMAGLDRVLLTPSPALGAWGRKQVEADYDLKSIANGVESIYDQLSGRGPGLRS